MIRKMDLDADRRDTRKSQLRFLSTLKTSSTVTAQCSKMMKMFSGTKARVSIGIKHPVAATGRMARFIRLKAKHVPAGSIVADVVLSVASSRVVIEGVAAAYEVRVTPDELSVMAGCIAVSGSIVLHFAEPVGNPLSPVRLIFVRSRGPRCPCSSDILSHRESTDVPQVIVHLSAPIRPSLSNGRQFVVPNHFPHVGCAWLSVNLSEGHQLSQAIMFVQNCLFLLAR